MTISRVIKRSRCLQSSCKSLILRICSITKSCITMKVFSLWATRIRWLLSIYLSTFLLWLYRRVLWRLQKVWSFFLFALFSWYFNSSYSFLYQNAGQTPNVKFVFANFRAHKGYHLNVTTVGTELVQRSSECALKCLESDPCLSFNLADLDDNIDNLLCELLASDHYIHSDKFITNHLWYHYSVAVKLFFFFYFILLSRIIIIVISSW